MSDDMKRIHEAYWAQPWHAEVLRLCEQHGFGAVMQSASEQWIKRDPVGALTVGPCAAQVGRNPQGGDLLGSVHEHAVPEGHAP